MFTHINGYLNRVWYLHLHIIYTHNSHTYIPRGYADHPEDEFSHHTITQTIRSLENFYYYLMLIIIIRLSRIYLYYYFDVWEGPGTLLASIFNHLCSAELTFTKTNNMWSMHDLNYWFTIPVACDSYHIQIHKIYLRTFVSF